MTGLAGWQVNTPARRAARDVAAVVPAATIRPAGTGQWQARLPVAMLAVTVTTVSPGALTCRLTALPALPLTLALAPWPATTVLRCPTAALPASGSLSLRDVRVTTRMGRTIRYLIPEFKTT